MGKARNLLQPVSVADMRGRALKVLRPSVEAFLLAAVALGCAQAGWSVLTPSRAGAADPTPNQEPEPTRVAMSEIRSPFAPEFAAVEGQSHAAAALLAGVQLAGVRVSDEPLHSGAVLTLGEGGQRAFLVGQEISSGVRLAEVHPDYVLLSYDGGQRQIAMPAAPSYSFARALMGQDQASAQSAAALAPATSQVVAAAPAEWLTATLSRVESTPDGRRGWRVAAPLPEAAAQAGLQDGDLVVAVNGVGPESPGGLLSAASSGRADLSIVRNASERLSVTIAIQAPT